MILTDFVKSQKINKEGLRSWLITFKEDSAIKSIFKPLFENNDGDINEKLSKDTKNSSEYENSFNFNNHIVTLDEVEL